MTEKELENKIGFIIEQQAQFMIDLQTLREEQTKAEKRISRLEGAIVVVVNLIGDTNKAQQATDATVKLLAEKVDAMTDRLDTIIDAVVERTLGDSNGNKQDENDRPTQ